MKNSSKVVDMNEVKKVLERLEEVGVRVPPQIDSVEGLINYLESRASILKMSIIGLHAQIEVREKQVKAIEEAIKILRGDKE